MLADSPVSSGCSPTAAITTSQSASASSSAVWSETSIIPCCIEPSSSVMAIAEISTPSSRSPLFSVARSEESANAQPPRTDVLSANGPASPTFTPFFSGRRFSSFFSRTTHLLPASRASARCSGQRWSAFSFSGSAPLKGFSNRPSLFFSRRILQTASSISERSTFPSSISSRAWFN